MSGQTRFVCEGPVLVFGLVCSRPTIFLLVSFKKRGKEAFNKNRELEGREKKRILPEIYCPDLLPTGLLLSYSPITSNCLAWIRGLPRNSFEYNVQMLFSVRTLNVLKSVHTYIMCSDNTFAQTHFTNSETIILPCHIFVFMVNCVVILLKNDWKYMYII